MNSSVQRLDTSQVHFGFEIEPAVDNCLQRAASRVNNRDQSLRALNDAFELAPDRLEVLQAQYKFHFYRGDLSQAEDFVFQTLIKAAIQGGFSYDWSTLDADSANWTGIRGPARFFIYALKALAFIRLRQNMPEQARDILATIERIDPQDCVGISVIRELMAGMESDEDDCHD